MNTYSSTIYDQNEPILITLRDQLNNDFRNILSFNPEFTLNGSIESKSNSYSMWAQKNDEIINGIKIKVSFTFECPTIEECLTKILGPSYSLNYDYSNEEFNGIAYKVKNINSMKILNFYIHPEGKGIGTQLMKILLYRIEETRKILKINLCPKSERSRIFYERFDFIINEHEWGMVYYIDP